jgi:TolA-binding protein
MEALRKAEEAKRQAAQKEREESDSEPPARATEALPVDDLAALEAQWDVGAPATPVEEPDIVLDTPLSMEGEAHAPSLDVPFDFHIDESFGTLDLTPAPAPVSKPEQLDSTSPEAPEPEIESLDPEIDYLKPEDLRQFKPALEPAPAVLSAPSPSLTLALEDDLDREETPRAAFIADPEVAALEETHSEPEVVVLPQEAPLQAAATPVTPAPALAPIRASRVDDAQEPEPQTASAPQRPRFKVPGIHATEENRKRESARAVFNAKTGQEPKGRNTRRLIAVAAVLALIPLAGGGFLLVQEMGLLGGGNEYNIPPAAYDAVPSFPVVEEQPVVAVADVQLADVVQDVVPELTVPADSTVPVTTDVPAETFVEAEPVADPAPVAAETLAAADVEMAAEEALPVPTGQSADEAPAVTENQAPVATQPEIAQQQTPAPVSATPPPAPINITRSNPAPLVNAQLTQAYTAFRDQDYYAARALYQQALRELPNNRDALLGLAATSIQLGDITGARANYSKLLELDPRDALARVGLMDSMPLGDSVQTEIQLQTLKAEHPEVAQLSFALGNFFASQRRWNEAQAAYYDALLAAKAESGSLVSPDFAFNLAVSLERLNQPQPAFDFYREALEQSRVVNPGFDVRVLRERLDALERVLP